MSEKGSAIDLSQYVIRVVTEDCRYRFLLQPTQTYAELLQLISEKTAVPAHQLQVFTQNGRRLNIQTGKRLRDVVYLRHGSILRVQLPKKEKRAASPASNIRNYNRPESKSKCQHPHNMRCLSCFSQQTEGGPDKGSGTALSSNKQTAGFGGCDHGANTKCLKCIDRPVTQQPSEKAIMATPIKMNPQLKEGCTHSANIKCRKCLSSPRNSKGLAMLNTQSSLSSPNTTKTVKSPIKNTIKSPNKPSLQTPTKLPLKSPQKDSIITPKPAFKKGCLHGQGGKCLNCIAVDSKQSQQQCSHGPNAKCLNCLQTTTARPAHVAFDQYLLGKRSNCQHPKESECPNCQPPQNLRLTLLPCCDQHEPYPRGLCNRCIPENVTLKRQEYRHVDYVQFMNNKQMRGFIDYWTQDKQMAELRVAFLYGYYAEDPYYKNGIRAVVEALYEPEQVCSTSKFQIKDPAKRSRNVELIVESLGLEKVGMVIASPNDKLYFTEEQVRTIAQYQEAQAVQHSTGYRLSNFFTVLVRPGKADRRAVEPQVFMVSDQGQAMQAASLFIPNPHEPTKMRLRTSESELLASVYQQGRKVEEFGVQFLLVNIASGASASSKFAMMRNNEFPALWRSRLKKAALREYLLNNSRKPASLRYSDFNLLVLLAELGTLQPVLQVALQLQSGELSSSACLLLQRRLQSLL